MFNLKDLPSVNCANHKVCKFSQSLCANALVLSDLDFFFWNKLYEKGEVALREIVQYGPINQ